MVKLYTFRKRPLMGKSSRLKTGAPAREPGEISKKVVEEVMRLYEESLGTKPRVDVEVSEDGAFWKVTIRLRRNSVRGQKLRRS